MSIDLDLLERLDPSEKRICIAPDCGEIIDTSKIQALHSHIANEHPEHRSHARCLDPRCLSAQHGFTTIDNLLRHIRTVHWELDRYRCLKCFGTFAGGKRKMAIHFAKHHPEVEVFDGLIETLLDSILDGRGGSSVD